MKSFYHLCDANDRPILGCQDLWGSEHEEKSVCREITVNALSECLVSFTFTCYEDTCLFARGRAKNHPCVDRLEVTVQIYYIPIKHVYNWREAH